MMRRIVGTSLKFRYLVIAIAAVMLYFGIGHERPQRLGEIGQHFGLTRERVRQIKQKALCKLRGKYPYIRGMMLN